MSNNESPFEDSSCDDDRVISGPSTGRVLGASTNPYVMHHLGQEFHKSPHVSPPIQRPPPYPTRGNQSNTNETSTGRRSSRRTRQGGTSARTTVPGAVAGTDKGGMAPRLPRGSQKPNCKNKRQPT